MLINSTKDIKEHYGTLNDNTTFATLKPYVKQATDKYLRPYIGEELLDELEAGVEGHEKGLSIISLTGKNIVLYQYLAASLTYYAVLDSMPFMLLTMGNNGLMEQSHQNLNPTRQWSYVFNENAAADKADTFLDRALEYLEANADFFPAWRNSEAYTISKESLIPNAKDLSRYLNIQGSRRSYLAFRPYLDRAEHLYLAPQLGYEMYDNLKESLRVGGALATETSKLLSLLKPALAQLALKEALPELAISITSSGYKVLSENDNIRNRQAATEKQLASLQIKAMELSNVYMAEVKRYLDTILQAGETLPSDFQQTWQPPDNSNSQAFWV